MITNCVKYGMYYVSAAIATNSALWFERPNGVLTGRDDAEIVEAVQERFLVSALKGLAWPVWESSWPTGLRSALSTTPTIRTLAYAGHNTMLAMQGYDPYGDATPAHFVYSDNDALKADGNPIVVTGQPKHSQYIWYSNVVMHVYDAPTDVAIEEQAIVYPTRSAAHDLLDASGNILKNTADYHPLSAAFFGTTNFAPSITTFEDLPSSGVIWPNDRPYRWPWEPATDYYYGDSYSYYAYGQNVYTRIPLVTNYIVLASVLTNLNQSIRVIKPNTTNLTSTLKFFSTNIAEQVFNAQETKYMTLWNTGKTTPYWRTTPQPLLYHYWKYRWYTFQSTQGGQTVWQIDQQIRSITNITQTLDWPSLYAITNGFVDRLRVYAVLTAHVNNAPLSVGYEVELINRNPPVGSYDGELYKIADLPWNGLFKLSVVDETGVVTTASLTRENSTPYAWADDNLYTPVLNMVYDYSNPRSASNLVVNIRVDHGTMGPPTKRTRRKLYVDAYNLRHGEAYYNLEYKVELSRLVVVVDWNWKHRLNTRR